MLQNLRAPLILVFLFLSWLFVLCALFMVASGSGGLFFMFALVPTLLFATLAVLSSQSFSNESPQGAPYFYASLISLLLVVVIIVSPFLSFLSPVRNASTAVVTKLSLFILGKTPYEWAHPVKNIDEWILNAQKLPSGKFLNFNTFPEIPTWTRVCIFPGHSTDAQFVSLIPLALPWKLSDKSKSTTHKDHAALVFVDDTTKTISHIVDIQQARIHFEVSIGGICLKSSRALLKRLKEPADLTGPTFGP